MRNEKERFDKTRYLEKAFGRKLKNEPLYKAASFRQPGKPVLYLDIFHKNTIHGWHDLIDESEDTKITSLFGTNEEVEREANKMYGKHYEIITTPMIVEPISEFGESMNIINRYRKKKITKQKPKHKVSKCRCKK